MRKPIGRKFEKLYYKGVPFSTHKPLEVQVYFNKDTGKFHVHMPDEYPASLVDTDFNALAEKFEKHMKNVLQYDAEVTPYVAFDFRGYVRPEKREELLARISEHLPSGEARKKINLGGSNMSAAENRELRYTADFYICEKRSFANGSQGYMWYKTRSSDHTIELFEEAVTQVRNKDYSKVHVANQRGHMDEKFTPPISDTRTLHIWDENFKLFHQRLMEGMEKLSGQMVLFFYDGSFDNRLTTQYPPLLLDKPNENN